MTTQNTQTHELENSTLYENPKDFCDVVMKGGLTSGVVYPMAICELARHYSFKNIGGTSAGAIGAAAAAAAEYSRRTKLSRDDHSSGFAGLAKIPQWLGGKGNLVNLFHANQRTAQLFAILDTGLGLSNSSTPKKVVVILLSVLKNFAPWTVLGLVIGLLITSPILYRGWVALTTHDSTTAISEILAIASIALLIILMIALLAVISAVIGLVLKVRSAVPANFYGLTTLLNDPNGNETQPPLTPWLADKLDELAGKKHRCEPLTFGDLRNAISEMDQERLSDDDSFGINLQMMTTNVTLGRPYRLPFETREYYYRPDEWKQFFPTYIMDWLKNQRREFSEEDVELLERRRNGFEQLPPAETLPVIVATRMSLSFPFLISAVPLWTIDRSMKETTKLERCLFSDGGIASNFPLHFFDRTLPRWPTFAFNLKSFHPEHPRDDKNEWNNSYLINRIGAGRADNWDRFEDKASGFSKLAGFGGALISTVYNWADNAQTRVPGYRDRIAHIFEAADEGGMNLNMQPETIDRLSQRGRFAGVKLRERFSGNDGTGLTWNNHRWVRYRSMMALFERAFQSFKRAYYWPPYEGQTYATMITRGNDEEPRSFRWRSNRQRDYAEELTYQLAHLTNDWQQEQEKTGQTFTDAEPHPVPELRIRPRI